MTENLSLPDNFVLSAGGINLLPYCLSCEIKRAAVGDGSPLFVQGIINLALPPLELPQPGDDVVTSVPFARNLVVQSVTSEQIVIGCALSLHNASQFGEAEVSPLSREVGTVVRKLLVMAGIDSFSFQNTKLLQRTINVQSGSSYVALAAEIAAAFGEQLYVHDGQVTSVKRKFKGQPSMAQLVKSELLEYKQEPGIALPAQKLICAGTLTSLKEDRKDMTQRSKTNVAGGVRTTVRKITFGLRSTKETTTVIEPLSAVSAFTELYETTNDPEKATAALKGAATRSTAIKSEETEIESKYDKDGYITKRTTTTRAIACKALSSFFSTWASAVSSHPELKKPTDLLKFVEISTQVEKWKYTLPKAAPLVTKPVEVFFSALKGSASYSRELTLTLGQLLPELGDPTMGYQRFSRNESIPIYTPPFRQVLAEVEQIGWELQENGSWATQRVLKQAQGLLDASAPINAMNSFSFSKGVLKAQTFNKKEIAIAIARTLVDVSSETSHSGSPPSAETVSSSEEYELSRDYRLEIKLTSKKSLLPRTIGFTPSEYATSLPDINDAAMFKAQQLLGASEKCLVSVPLRAAVASELKPLSMFTIGQDKYLLDNISCKIDTSGARISFSGYAIQ